ncbi:MAG: TonB C-terminal domain-containing protein [Verrucomicrobiota bacterium]|jgi:type IV secretory pathway VirB10-like protein
MARRRKNSPRVNLAIATALHALLIGLVFLFAAREGILGKKLKDIAVVLVPKEKPPEPPKPPPEQHIEPPKTEDVPKPQEPPKLAQAPQQIEPAPKAAPPPGDMAPVAAPAAVIPADFSFDDGAKPVATGTNGPIGYYKNFAEYTLRSNWTRPEDIPDDNFVDIVEVSIDLYGNVRNYALKSRSGNQRWDDSVRQALAATKTIGREPPRGFPLKFDVRFDVLPATETIAQ